jgi:hypothetical protein
MMARRAFWKLIGPASIVVLTVLMVARKKLGILSKKPTRESSTKTGGDIDPGSWLEGVCYDTGKAAWG